MAIEDLQELPVEGAAAQHAICQVRPIERTDQHLRVLQPQLGDDVAPDAFGRRRGERVQRDIGKIVPQASELPILRPKIVAPLADAVGFIDRDEPHAALPQHAPESLTAFAHEPLGRYVEQPATILVQAGDHGVARVRRQRAVEIRRGNAVDAQPVDLILHQRDQRRHDERKALTAVGWSG